MRTWASALLACSAMLMSGQGRAEGAEPGDAGGDAATPRFQLTGKVALAPGAVGRFAIQGQARYTAEDKPATGRFALKSTAAAEAECGPGNDVFADGFEGPS